MRSGLIGAIWVPPLWEESSMPRLPFQPPIAAPISEPVIALGIGVEQRCLFVVAGPSGDRARGRDPIGERAAGKGGDGMVRAPDHPVPAEALDDMLDIGAQRFGGDRK